MMLIFYREAYFSFSVKFAYRREIFLNFLLGYLYQNILLNTLSVCLDFFSTNDINFQSSDYQLKGFRESVIRMR